MAVAMRRLSLALPESSLVFCPRALANKTWVRLFEKAKIRQFLEHPENKLVVKISLWLYVWFPQRHVLSRLLSPPPE
jgi:hypothetical protein